MQMLCFLVLSLSGLCQASSSAIITAQGELLVRGNAGGDSPIDDLSKTEAHANEAIRQKVNGSTPTGWIQVGTPPKWLFVIFDTGSDKLVAKTWDTVANELQSVDQGEDGMILPSARLYDHSNSSTYRRRFLTDPRTHKIEPDQDAITYGSGTAITDVGSDTINVGRRSLKNFTLMEITKDSLDLLHTSKGIAGILGLQHMKDKKLGRSLFSRMREEGKLTSFGYCRGTGNNGTFIWGDNSTEGTAIDVVGDMHWAVKLGKVDMVHPSTGKLISLHSGESSRRKSHSPDAQTDDDEDDSDIVADAGADESGQSDAEDLSHYSCHNNECCGILDTGSNIIAGPKAVMQNIAAKAKVAPDCSNFDSLPAISLVFGGMPVVIQPRGYVMKMKKPPGGFANGMEDGSSSSGDSADDPRASLHSIKAHGEPSEAGLAQKQALGSGAHQWRAAFERLYKENGVDMRDMINDILSNFGNDTAGPEFMCMPMLVPLDKQTKFGPLYIVGTPLLETYYARWSFDKNATSPQIHLKPNHQANACRAQGGELLDTSSSSLLRKEALASEAGERSFPSGIIERRIEDITFPHWAKSLVTV